MDKERERIQDDLRGLIDGDVRCDDVFVQMYASDASVYEIRPLGVVRPRGLSDVVACVQYAAENALPIHARGAGTGVAGESLGAGLVLDFSFYMRRVLEVNDDRARIQPGIIHAQLNRTLAPYGRLFGPDPATRSVTTMGSVLALDGSGSHWPQYGSARGRVERMQVVLADGAVIEAANDIPINQPDADPRRGELVRRLVDLIQRHQAEITTGRPKSAVNRSGYHVYDILRDGQLRLADLIVGSEGTLGLITEATVRTDLRPKHRGVVLLFFDRLENAAQAALLLSTMGVSACDLMDRRLLTISREVDVRFDVIIPRDAEAMLLVEQHGDDASELRERLKQVIARVQRRKRLAFDSCMTMDKEERDLYWHLARRVVPRLHRLRGSTRPIPFVEDIAIPPQVLPEFLVTIQNVQKAHQVTATLFAHAVHGQLHIRPFLDLANPEDIRKMQGLAQDLYEETLKVGGTISGEHGDGLSRTWFAQKQHGELHEVFRSVKRIFDPQNIFNPGKVVADAPQPPSKNLRPVVAATEESFAAEAEHTGPENVRQFQPIKLQIVWEQDDIAHAARICNGCGRCRTESPEERMCPIFRFAPREEASPRAKANLVRAILTGRLSAKEFSKDHLKAVADLCVNCHQCRLECPANVDIPKLVLEAKAQYVATNGLPPTEALLLRLDKLCQVGSSFATLTNWAFGNHAMRWLIEKTLGIAQGRKLPKFAMRTFLRDAARRRLTRQGRFEGRKVFYFVDVYANWFDVQLADAFVSIMRHNGAAVFVHPRQIPSGMSAVSVGAVDTARRYAARNIPLLAEAVRQGYHVVTTEPSATLCLTHEYLNLVDDDDVRLVAKNTSDACDYLWKMHQTGDLALDFSPVNATVGYHLPCHMRALNVGSPGENLLRLIPGISLKRIEKGCSGMAGTFGLKRKNYRSSLRAGWGVISALRDPAIQVGTTECSACKIQMEQGTTKPTIHPLKLLALSYGLMPELASLLTTRGEELIVT
ncbi:MAG: anaerobic glycerol-3-phosphate dehydrogenase subunit C [Pirellulaceae bacterium]